MLTCVLLGLQPAEGKIPVRGRWPTPDPDTAEVPMNLG